MAARPAAAAAQPFAWRQEVFAPPAQLPTLAPMLHRLGVTAVNVPNKSKHELPGLLESCRALRTALPASVDVCCHFAINNNYNRSADASFRALTAFMEQLGALDGCSVLLVSGGGPCRALDSVGALERLADSPTLRQLPPLPLAVAFNPFFPDAERREEERQRLRRKLQAGGGGMVSAVYLQAGSDAALLDAGLLFLRQLLSELPAQQQQSAQQQHQSAQQQPSSPERPAKRARAEEQQQQRGAADAPVAAAQQQIYASVLVPSKKLLAQFKFRPWGGVFLRCAPIAAAVPPSLPPAIMEPPPSQTHPRPHSCAPCSERYLSSTEAADAVTAELLRVLRRHSVTPLVETAVESEADVRRLEQLWQAASGGGDSV